MLHLREPVTIVGRSPDAVIVRSPERTEEVSRTSAVHVGDVTWAESAVIRNITFVHEPGPVTGLQAPRAFVTVGNVPGGPTGGLTLQNVVYAYNGPDKTWVRDMRGPFALVLDHVTFAASGPLVAGLSWPGGSSATDVITNSILENLWPGYDGPSAGATIEHSLINGPPVFEGERILLARPQYLDRGALDFRLVPGSAGTNGSDPDADCLDADGTAADMGAYGGDGAICAGPQFPIDADGDGYGAEAIGLRDADCDDADPRRHPGAEEVCDGVDNDCDGMEVLLEVERVDVDQDGAPACVDCDDDDPDRAPGLPELCDDVDNDCDDDTWAEGGEEDADADGTLACHDCNDADPLIHPGAVEECDGIDNDCSGETERLDELSWANYYRDSDGDGFGVEGSPFEFNPACAPPEGYAAETDAFDCDDADRTTHPDADETSDAGTCQDGQDNDCDVVVDQEDPDCLTGGCASAILRSARPPAWTLLAVLALGCLPRRRP